MKQNLSSLTEFGSSTPHAPSARALRGNGRKAILRSDLV